MNKFENPEIPKIEEDNKVEKTDIKPEEPRLTDEERAEYQQLKELLGKFGPKEKFVLRGDDKEKFDEMAKKREELADEEKEKLEQRFLELKEKGGFKRYKEVFMEKHGGGE